MKTNKTQNSTDNKQIKKNSWWKASKWVWLAILIISLLSYIAVWIIYGANHNLLTDSKRLWLWRNINDWFFIQTIILVVIGAVVNEVAVAKSNNWNFKVSNTIGLLVEVILALVGVYFLTQLNDDIYWNILWNGKIPPFIHQVKLNGVWYDWLLSEIPVLAGIISFTSEMMSKKLYNKYNKVESKDDKDENNTK